MSVQLPEFVTKLIDNIAIDTGFIDYRIETETGSKPNDGITATLTRVTIIDVHAESSEKLHLMCKWIPQHTINDMKFQIHELFEREVLMYTKVLPLFLDFQHEKGLTADECFQAYPKCHASIVDRGTNQFAIIMEDLQSQNYRMWDSQTAPPVDHLRAVLHELARFHAVSFALKDQRPHVFEEFRQLYDVLLLLYEDCGFDSMINEVFDHAIATTDNPVYVAKLTELRDRNTELLKYYLDKDIFGAYDVIGHGDCWTNNSMFRYQGNESSPVLSDVRILDWQLGRYQSLLLDLHDATLTTSDRETRQHFPELFQYYYDKLHAAIQQLGTDPNKFLNLEEFREQTKFFGKYGFSTAIFVAPLILPTETPSDTSDESNEYDKIGWKLYAAPSKSKFHQRIHDLLVDCINMGYI